MTWGPPFDGEQSNRDSRHNGVVRPFASSAVELARMFDLPDAAVASWHRTRAEALQRDASVQTVAALTEVYERLAARHLVTAQLLEWQRSVSKRPARRGFEMAGLLGPLRRARRLLPAPRRGVPVSGSV